MVAVSVFASLPVIENFDSALATNVWTTNGAVGVESSALKIINGTATRTIAETNTLKQIRISFSARISDLPQSDPAEIINTQTSVAFYVATNGQLVVYDGTNKTTLSTVVPTTNWVRFDIFCDYNANLWSLNMDKTEVAAGLEFYSTSSQLESVVISNNSTNSVLFDTLIITDDTIPTDGSIPAGWEAQYGVATNYVPLNGRTMLENFIAGLDPTDPNDGLELTRGADGSLTWNQKLNRTYDIQWTTDLMDGFSEANIETVVVSGKFKPNLEADPSRFYRIRVRQN